MAGLVCFACNGCLSIEHTLQQRTLSIEHGLLGDQSQATFSFTEGDKQACICAQNKNLLISLPDDVLFKILLNHSLSTEDIHRASVTCRRLYYDTIRSAKFVNLHLRQTDEYGLVFRYGPNRCCRHPFRRAVFVSMKHGRVTVSEYTACKFRYILKTSCNGLILEYTSCNPLPIVHVANPITGPPFKLPPLPENADGVSCSVGYAEASKAYKVALSYSYGRRDPRWAVFTVGVDSSWRNLANKSSTLGGAMLVTEGFVHSISISRDTVVTLNVETEVMTTMRAPMPEDAKCWFSKEYLSTGKSLTLVVEVEDRVFRVWEMVCEDYAYCCYYWKEWEREIVLLGTNVRYLSSIQPVGWLQQMEVLVFKGSLRNDPCRVFYVVIATGEIGWIDPISRNKKGRLGGEDYTIRGSVFPHKNTFVNPLTV
ncbi:Unknown protein [Striga hermonthica]|uniref:F-box associated beta-propeller type 3 domain-containing protein n=1 Tax=Striga hermonthica TaxID=68872 RepID=A0A9N7RE17_STRHE|nr:Unknown protein [Striga hermonthica]